MRNHATPSAMESTAHREWISSVIVDSSSCRHRASCDLNQLLTLRGSGRSVIKGAAVVWANNRHKV
jgi:hypothetical protein